MSGRRMWTFISNHGAVMGLIGQHGRIAALQIAAELKITERSVIRIIQELEREGYVEKRREGRSNKYEVRTDLPLGRADQRRTSVGELLRILTFKD